jgi:hypothetical protein
MLPRIAILPCPYDVGGFNQSNKDLMYLDRVKSLTYTSLNQIDWSKPKKRPDHP